MPIHHRSHLPHKSEKSASPIESINNSDNILHWPEDISSPDPYVRVLCTDDTAGVPYLFDIRHGLGVDDENHPEITLNLDHLIKAFLTELTNFLADFRPAEREIIMLARLSPKILAAIRDGKDVEALLEGEAEPALAIKEEKMSLPTKARILYSERASEPYLAKLDIIEFLRAEYGPWLDGTLTRPDLRRLGPGGEMALRNWLRTRALPDDVKLPTRSAVNDQLVEDAPRVRAAQRLASAAARRGAHTPNI